MNRLSRASWLFSFLFLAPLAAQGLLLAPDPTPGPVPRPPGHRPSLVQIVRTAVAVEIVDGVATTTIDQVFRNEGDRDAEGTWFLPLPAGAFADGFTMTVGGKEVVGEALDQAKARAVYEAIVRQRRDPGLLEFAGEGLLRARIFPIPARGEVGATVRLRQVLLPTGGLYEWAWPLRAARHGDAAVGAVGVTVRIRSQTALATVLTPYAHADIRRIGDREATVSFEGSSEQLEDLKVLYGLAAQEFGLHALAHRTAGEPGTFVLLLSPPRTLPADRQPRRCVQFVVDTSGSMAGAKIEQAKRALHVFLGSLRPDDTFQVVTFASGVQSFFERPLSATAENVAAARQRVDRLQAMGGTDIAGALQQAFAAVPGDDGDLRLSQIVFVTDGQPTVGITAPQQILDLTRQLDARATRLFALGVGDEIDVRLIDDLVQQHRGARDFVRSRESIEVKVDALCQKIAQPALCDVEVRCDSLDAFDVHPSRTRDLFCGEVLQVTGRYRRHGAHKVLVRGRQHGVEREFAFAVELPEVAAQHAFVPVLWARQHVAALLDAIRRNGAQPELVGEVRRLATQFGIVTPYTSQLIVEEGMRLAGRDGRRDHRGPADDVPGPRGGGAAGPTTGGPVGPAAPGLAGRALHDLGKRRTGADAVAESEAVGGDDFHLGATRRDAGERGAAERTLLRRAAGRVFLAVGEELVEQGLPADWRHQAVVVEAWSAAWFALALDRAELRPILALGSGVVFRDGARIVQVRPPAAPAPADPGGGR